MDISKIFKSRTRKELFRLYFTNPDQDHYLRELERVLRIPVSMIRNELIRLEEDGIFLSRRKGNQTYYALNQSYPLFDELKSIVFKTIGIQGLLREILAKVTGIEVAFIYAARAFLLLKGFRPADGYQHKTVVEFMSHFLGKEFKTIVEQFDRMRRKRNIFSYEIDMSISKSEASNALDRATMFVNLVKRIIQKENPQMEFNF